MTQLSRYIQRLREKYQNPRRIFNSRAVVLVALGVMILASFHAGRIFLKERGLKKELAALQAEIAKVQTENTRLENEIQNTRSREIIEKIAKEQLNLRKPGEKVTVIIPAAFSSTTTSGTSPVSLWERVKSYLKEILKL